MAKYHGRNARVHLDDSGGTLRDISVGVDSVDAPSDQDIVDVSGFGDSKKNYVTGLQDTTVTLAGPWDDTATTGAHTVLSGLVGGTASQSFKYFPRGSASGAPVFQGEYQLSQYNVQAAMGGAVKYTAKLTPFGTQGGSWTTV